MKYFVLTNSIDPEVCGKYPQTDHDDYYFDRLDPTNLKELRLNNFLNHEKYFKRFLSKEAKLTDLLDRCSVSWGLVISAKFKEMLGDFNLPKHRFYPIDVIKDQCAYQYYWFHFYVDMFDHIDLDISTFEVFSNSDFRIIDERPITSEAYIRGIQQSLSFEYGIRLKKVYLKPAFPKYDLWQNNIYGLATVISEKLKLDLEKNSISGCETKPFRIIM